MIVHVCFILIVFDCEQVVENVINYASKPSVTRNTRNKSTEASADTQIVGRITRSKAKQIGAQTQNVCLTNEKATSKRKLECAEDKVRNDRATKKAKRAVTAINNSKRAQVLSIPNASSGP